MKTHLFLSAFVTLLSINLAAYEALQTPKKISWIMAHNPTNSENNELILEFTKRVKEKSKGKLLIETTFMSNQTKNRHSSAYKKVRSGEAGISQLNLAQLTELSQKVNLFQIPFLFESHAQIKAAIHGEIGDEIKSDVFNASKNQGQIRGLAFTYSGGYYALYGSKKINSIEDFSGMRMQTMQTNPKQEWLQKLNVKFVDFGMLSREDTISLHMNNKIDLEDTELVRPYILVKEYPKFLKKIKYVYELNHAVYLTMIIVNEKIFAGLSKDQQELLVSEIDLLAEKERTLSIQQADDARKYLTDHGVEFVRLDKPTISKMQVLAKEVVQNYYSQLAHLIEKVKNLSLANKSITSQL
jgi:TRAP-type C4-dicarboxylate transport system substrate-binding protein